jgi:outer membrane protein assembly factor BamB
MKSGSRFAVWRPARVSSDNTTKRVAKLALFLCVSLAIGLSSVRTASAAGVTLTLSSTSGPPTSNLLVSAGGFPASTAVDIYFDTTDVALAVTSGTGAFSGIALKVPASAVPGTHWVTAVARGTSGKAAQASFLVQTNWAQFHYSVLHKSVNPYENVLSPTTVGSIGLDWSFTTGGEIYLSAPAVANGVVYVGSTDFNLYALNSSTGALLWKYATANGVYSSPAVANGVVYFGSQDSNLYALNATTGTLLWKYTTGRAVESSPTVANGVVYVGSDDCNLYALNGHTGALLWKYTAGGAVYSSPAWANGVVYFGSADNSLYALNGHTGALLWNYTTLGGIDGSSPAVANGVVYVGSNDENIYALDAPTGSPLWQYTTGNAVYSGSAVANGVVYAGSADGTLYAFDETGGTLAKKFRAPARRDPRRLRPDLSLQPSQPVTSIPVAKNFLTVAENADFNNRLRQGCWSPRSEPEYDSGRDARIGLVISVGQFGTKHRRRCSPRFKPLSPSFETHSRDGPFRRQG